MFKKAVLFLLFCYRLNGMAAPVPVKYQFSIDTTGAQPALQVSVTIKGTDSGKTWLQLPDVWASQKELWRAVSNLQVITRGVRMDTTNNPALRVLYHQPGVTIRFRYTLQQDWAGELQYPQNYRAVVTSSYIHFTGYSLFVYPKQVLSAHISVSLNWGQMPGNWQVANSLHAGTRKYNGVVELGNFINAVYVAGNYRLHRVMVRQQPVYLAIRGNRWKFTDSALMGAIEKVILAERNFWNDHTEPYYLVTMSPFAGQGSYNGSALYQSFLTGATEEISLNNGLLSLLAHEYFHRWNGVAMAMKGDEQENAWFGEGFTEYYTYKLLYESGLIPHSEFIKNTNRTIAEYYLSPVKNADKATMGKNFWGSRDYQLLPYKKGFTYALYLEQFIRKESAGKHSLNQLMFALLKAAQQKEPVTEQLFLDIIQQYTGSNITTTHEDYIHRGKTIPVLSGSLGPGVKDSIVLLGVFELGFDYEASVKAKKLTGVKEGSAAWKAGLRNGQPWAGASIYFDNISIPAEVYVMEENGKTKQVSYMPVAAEKIPVVQFGN